MPDPPKRPNPADLAREAKALRSTPMIGPGKLVIPAAKPGPPLPPRRSVPLNPELRSSPIHEETKPASPAPPHVGSWRKDSPPPVSGPPPVELAPQSEPQSVQEAHRHAREKVAEAERKAPARPSGPVLDSIKIELPSGLRGGLGAIGKALLGAIVAALLGGGGAVVGSQTANPVPPAVAECPAQLEQLRGEVRQLRDRVGAAESDVDEARAERRRTDRKVEDVIGELEHVKKSVPRIEGVTK
jgi:outer membrane murein-binding lipoprotein Lpp